MDGALDDTPAVLVCGPRQCGKSTLVRAVGERRGWRYATLDDPLLLADAQRDPGALLDRLGDQVILDEVQRAPGLFLPLKLRIDRERRPGRWLLTGSANVLLVPKIADSLAGRIEVIDLQPLSQAELEQSKANFVDALFRGDLEESVQENGPDLSERIVRGGYPEPALRAQSARRNAWFQSYVRTLLDRDVRDLSQVEGLAQMPRLLALLAARQGESLNVLGLARLTGIPHTTLTRYLHLLKALMLTLEVPAWSAETGTRLLKGPKLFLADSGLAAHLTRRSADALRTDHEAMASALEGFTAAELARLAGASETRPWLLHLRTVRRHQVAFVLEAPDGRVVGIDLKNAPSLQPDDLAGLEFLRDLTGDRFVRGVVLTVGGELREVGDRLAAAPISRLWS